MIKESDINCYQVLLKTLSVVYGALSIESSIAACPAAVVTYLFVVQQAVSGGEADRVCIELRRLVLVVELETTSFHGDLLHFFLPVVDGDLEVVYGRLLR